MNTHININKVNPLKWQRIPSIFLLFFVFSCLLYGISPVSNQEGDIKTILNTVSPSIVKVVVENQKRYYATGIAVDTNLVISNIKVLTDYYQRIYVINAAGKEYNARLIGKDPQSSIILLQIDTKALTPIKWTKKSEIGDWVALVGAFYKKFPAIYNGFISSRSNEEMLLNAPVAPGASGGAVVDKKGELVAVVRGRFGFTELPSYTYVGPDAELIMQGAQSGAKELCYALPAEKVMNISADLKKYGKVKRGWLGVEIIPTKTNVMISAVRKDSPAEKAGLRKGDILVKLNGMDVFTPIDIAQVMKQLKPQQKSKIQWLRNNAQQSALIVVGEAPEGGTQVDFNFPLDESGRSFFSAEFPDSLPNVENYIFRVVGSASLGLDVVTINPELAREFNVQEGTGLLISRVYENTAADKAGLRVADILVKVGDKRIASNSDLRQILNTLPEDQAVTVHLYRKGKPIKVVLTPNRNEHLSSVFDRFTNQLRNLHISIDEENQLKAQALEKYRKEQGKKNQAQDNTAKDTQKQKELATYKAELEKMRKEQEQMRQEMKKLKELLEKKEKEKENKK